MSHAVEKKKSYWFDIFPYINRKKTKPYRSQICAKAWNVSAVLTCAPVSCNHSLNLILLWLLSFILTIRWFSVQESPTFVQKGTAGWREAWTVWYWQSNAPELWSSEHLGSWRERADLAAYWPRRGTSLAWRKPGFPWKENRWVVVGLPKCCEPQDRVVWAVDDRNNVYARDKLTPSFPIGTSWVVVPGTGVKDICMSEHMVWATCPNGDIACRYGVSETNCVGDYWKKVPGNFELISVSPDDQLWAIDQNGQLFHAELNYSMELRLHSNRDRIVRSLLAKTIGNLSKAACWDTGYRTRFKIVH